MMSNTIEMPENVVTGNFPVKRVSDGTYGVEVKEMSKDENRVKAVCVVVDEGEFEGAKIFDSFSLDYDEGQRMFREFLDALGIRPRKGTFDLNACVGKTMSVSVKQKDDGNKVYVNVTQHLPL